MIRRRLGEFRISRPTCRPPRPPPARRLQPAIRPVFTPISRPNSRPNYIGSLGTVPHFAIRRLLTVRPRQAEREERCIVYKPKHETNETVFDRTECRVLSCSVCRIWMFASVTQECAVAEYINFSSLWASLFSVCLWTGIQHGWS